MLILGMLPAVRIEFFASVSIFSLGSGNLRRRIANHNIVHHWVNQCTHLLIEKSTLSRKFVLMSYTCSIMWILGSFACLRRNFFFGIRDLCRRVDLLSDICFASCDVAASLTESSSATPSILFSRRMTLIH